MNAASTSELFQEFERLLGSYSGCLEFADKLESPNPEDSRLIKMAIVGFSYHDATSNWEAGHCDIASDYLAESESAALPDGAKLFSMLAFGALLGMLSSEKIDDRVYGLGRALLPGFVYGKGSDVCDLQT